MKPYSSQATDPDSDETPIMALLGLALRVPSPVGRVTTCAFGTHV